MKRIQVRYRRRSETCKACLEPIDHDPTTDGCLYGWKPKARTCYYCWCIQTFGPSMQPTEAWWRLARRLVMAGHALSLHNDGTEHDDITF